MIYGRYYIDSMPTQDDTDDDYVVVYACDPNARDFDPARDEVASFTVVQAERRGAVRCMEPYTPICGSTIPGRSATGKAP